MGDAVTPFRPGDHVYAETTAGSRSCPSDCACSPRSRPDSTRPSQRRLRVLAAKPPGQRKPEPTSLSPNTPEQSLTTFPEIWAARMVENSLYLGVLLLWVIHGLGLYLALRRTSPTPALVGAALSTLGLVLLAAGAIPHVATAPLSDLYHAPGATSQDQATLVLLWHGLEAMFDGLLYTGLVILPLGLIALGKAMFGAPGYGPRIAGTTLALGGAGLAAATAVLVGVTDMAAVGVFALVGFHVILGRRNLKLARAPHSRTLAGA